VAPEQIDLAPQSHRGAGDAVWPVIYQSKKRFFA